MIHTDSYKVDGVVYEMEYWQINPYEWECRVKDPEYDVMHTYRTIIYDYINDEQVRYRCWIGFSNQLQRRSKRMGIVSNNVFVHFMTQDMILMQDIKGDYK